MPAPPPKQSKPPLKKNSGFEEAMTQLGKSYAHLSNSHAQFMTDTGTNF